MAADLLPAKLKREPLVDADLEVRFSPSIPGIECNPGHPVQSVAEADEFSSAFRQQIYPLTYVTVIRCFARNRS